MEKDFGACQHYFSGSSCSHFQLLWHHQNWLLGKVAAALGSVPLPRLGHQLLMASALPAR